MQPLASSQTSGPSQLSGPLAASGGSQPPAPQQRRLQSDSQSDGRASSSGGAHAGSLPWSGAHAGLLAETQPANRAMSEDAAPGQAAVRLTAGALVGAGSRGHEGSSTVLGGGEKSLVDRHIVATQAAAQVQVCEILQSPCLSESDASRARCGAPRFSSCTSQEGRRLPGGSPTEPTTQHGWLMLLIGRYSFLAFCTAGGCQS